MEHHARLCEVGMDQTFALDDDFDPHAGGMRGYMKPRSKAAAGVSLLRH